MARLLAHVPTSVSNRSTSKRKSDANDLGVKDSKQARLQAYPVSMFGAKKRCFNPAWYQRGDWLEYSVRLDVAFCYACRNFEFKAVEDLQEKHCESTFSINGYRNCKNATETNRGFSYVQLLKLSQEMQPTPVPICKMNLLLL